MNKKTIWNDWGLWLLIAMNLCAIYFYFQNPNSINTIIIIFWIQSVFIGIFNAIGMVNFTNRVKTTAIDIKNANNNPGCSAAFFTFHYGFFHVGYAVFLLIKLNFKHIDWMFVKLSLYTIVLGCIIQFIQDKRHNKTEAVNINTMFFMPYARIFPMHLAILLPAFFHISIGIVFLSLKTVADVIMHIVYRKYMFKQVENIA